MAVRQNSPYTFSVADSDIVTGSGFYFEPRDSGAGMIQLTGTFTATIVPEATVDGTNYFALPVTPIAGGADVTSFTAAGRWRANLSGLVKVRFRCSAFTSGTPILTIGVTPGSLGLAATSQSGSFASTDLIVLGGATSLGKNEDSAHTTGDAGVMMLGVQKATPADISTDGDYTPPQISGGYMYVHPKNIVNEDVAVGAAQPLGMAGAVRTHSPANTSGTDGDAEPLQVENGCLWVQNKGPNTASGIAGVQFTSADASSTVACTSAPTAGQKLVIDYIILSTLTAMTLEFEEETSGTVIIGLNLAANSQPVFLHGLNIKLPTADKKLFVDTNGAGQINITVGYHSEA